MTTFYARRMLYEYLKTIFSTVKMSDVLKKNSLAIEANNSKRCMAAWFWLHQYQTIFLIRRKSLCINRQESIYGFFSLNTFKNFKSFRAKQIIFQNLRQISDGLAFCYLTTHNLLVYTVELSGKTKFGNRSWNSPATMIKRTKIIQKTAYLHVEARS